MGRKGRREAGTNKEEKQEEFSQKGIQYHEPYYPKDLPRRDDRKWEPNGLPRREDRKWKRSQSSIEPTGYGVLRAPHWVTQEPQWERAAHFQDELKRTERLDELKRTERLDEHSKSRNQRTECVRRTKLGRTTNVKNDKNNKSTKCKTKNRKKEKHTECMEKEKMKEEKVHGVYERRNK